MKQINLNGINCWIINLMPFPKDERYSSEVLPFQQECIKNNIFHYISEVRLCLI